METNCDMPTCSQISDIQEIKKDTTQIKTNVKEITDALLGNEFNDHNGYFKRLAAIETDVKKIKGKTIFFSGIGAGIAYILGLITSKIF